MMFRPVMENRPLLRDGEAHRIRSCGLATIVNCLSARIKNDSPSGISRTAAPIYVIAIHEQVFVEQANRIEGFAADEGETSDDYIHGECLVVWEIKHMLARKEPRILEFGGETTSGTKVVPKRWESPATALQRHVGVEDPRAYISYLGILIQKIGECVQATWKNDYVRIYQRDVTPLGLPDRHVVSLRKAKVFRALDQFHPGKLCLDHFNCAVGRRIVHNKHFHAAARRHLGQTIETKFQIMLGVPGDDDHG